MQAEKTTLTGEVRACARALRALVPSAETVTEPVASIIDRVRVGGDVALEELTRRFDTLGGATLPLAVAPQALDRAVAELEPAVRFGLETAIDNVTRVARGALREDKTVIFATHKVILRSAALGSAGVYVPGGRAAYPSTVVMGVATARAASVRDVAVVSPPGRDGELPQAVLAACRLAGAGRVYRVGGAQAVAALALGTDEIAPVDIVVGPGNLYVQEAKRQLSGMVAIDSFAGPSDLVAVATEGTGVELLALDLLAQAEHGAGTLVVAISPSGGLLEELRRALEPAPESGAVLRLVEVPDISAALALAEVLAPEHLQLMGREAAALASRITRAGSIFVETGAAFGDYVAGSNHVLPTGGSARFASALSANTFRRAFTETRVAHPEDLATAAAPLARAEGFPWHARSMEARMEENPPA